MGYGSFSKAAEQESARKPLQPDSIAEHFCNLCKKIFSTVTELEGHLIEHSFQGCEERGYKCYICSSIFTLPSGLHQHMHEHGANYRPYDCNLCTKKYFFRAELENHLIDHENGRIDSHPLSHRSNDEPDKSIDWKHESKPINDDDSENESNIGIKSEINPEPNDSKCDEDDEYIEVEQIAENHIEKTENSTENCHDGHDETGSN